MRVGMLIISKKDLAIDDIMTSMEAIRDESLHHIDMYQIKLGETQSQARHFKRLFFKHHA